MIRMRLCLFLWLLGGTVYAQSDETIPPLFAERIFSTVSVSYTIEREIDRQQTNVVGLVVDDAGLIVLLGNAVAEWLPPDRITELRVHLPNSADEGFPAEFLGQDFLNGWYYVRAAEPAWAQMRSILSYPTSTPAIGEWLWGVCLTDENLDYLPYFRDGRLSAAQAFPLMTGFLTADVATPGSAVFNRAGDFVGWAGLANPVEREMWIGGEVYRVNLRNNVESHAFIFADDFIANLGRVPPSVVGSPRPWLGLSGLRPIDRDTADFLGLRNQGAVIVSEVLPGSPALAAGFEPRDIVVAIDGERIARFKPDSVVQAYLERSIRGRAVGAEMRFTVVRGETEIELTATLAQGPKLAREAQRRYLEKLGLTLRELVVDDALARRVEFAQMNGVLASFVKPNSPPSVAGLEPGDWIMEIDGVKVIGFEDGLAAFERIQADPTGAEYLLLVSRNNETSVLRVRRN